MSEDLKRKWKEAEESGDPIPIGRIVVCDFCDDDYTDKDTGGGFIFGSKAVCPSCEGETRKSIAGYGEEHYIKAECPEGQSFADFVRGYRGADATISVRLM